MRTKDLGKPGPEKKTAAAPRPYCSVFPCVPLPPLAPGGLWRKRHDRRIPPRRGGQYFAIFSPLILSQPPLFFFFAK